jgi:leucyl-tRNA synthetase
MLLSPFAPHIAEELWARLGNDKELMAHSWPSFDPDVAAEERVTLVVQVNGKLRGRIEISADELEDDVKRKALDDENVRRFIDGKEVRRVVVVPRRVVNVVVAP